MPVPERYFVTVDAIVVAEIGDAKSVLLIRRGHEPFAGSWALPGGFVDIDEDLDDAARRELLEETGLRIGDVIQIGAFGDPNRDPRGRAISVAFLAILDSEPAPRAGDDAAEARWFPIDHLPTTLAFDHERILESGLRRLADGP